MRRKCALVVNGDLGGVGKGGATATSLSVI